MSFSKSIHWSRQLMSVIAGFVIVTFAIFQLLLVCHEPNNVDNRRQLWRATSSISVQGKNPHISNEPEHISKKPLAAHGKQRSTEEFETKVACIIPYIGSSLPVWFDAFAFSALSSSPMFDYLIFVTEVPNRELPSNVKIIQISSDDFYGRIARLDQTNASEVTYRQNMLSTQMLMKLFPYALVEFKPCLGVIFSDYLSTYSHWALADIDVLVGKMHTMITPSILNQYDIYTSSFGDNFRLYMRGQLTIHKNNEYVNNVWRGCHHLSYLSQRLRSFHNTGYKVWEFQSAEGCYSSVVVNDKNLSILVATTQFSEAYKAETEDLESFLYGESLYRCNDNRKKMMDLESVNTIDCRTTEKRENSSSNFSESQLSSEWHHVERVRTKCSPWIRPEFEVCLGNIPPNSLLQVVNNVSSIKAGGRYLFVENIRQKAAPRRALNYVGGSCVEGAVSHFQRWKRGYYHFSTRPPPLDAHLTLVTDTGFIPLRLLNSQKGQSYGELLSIRMPLGRVTPIEIQAAARFALASSVASGIDSLVALRVTGRRKISRLLGNNPSEESRSTSPNHGNSRHTSVSSGLSTAYCANFSPDLKKCNCNIHGDQIAVRTSICGVEDKDYRDVMTVQHRQQMQNRSDNEDQSKSLKALKSPEFKRNERRKWRSPCTTFAAVTLITVTSMEEYQAGTLDQMLQSWCGPKIVVISVPHDLDPDIKRTDSCSDESLTVIEVTMRPCKDTQEHKSNGLHVVPDNTMYNIGLDSAATDLVCLSPPSAIFQPLDSIIFESQLRGHTAILDKIDELPTALVVPLYYALQGRKVHSTGDSHRNSTANSGGRLRGDEVSLRETGSAPLSRYRDAGANGSKSSEASSSANYFPYPSRTSLYASQQSKRLQKPFRVASSRHQGTKDLLEVPFNAEDFMHEHSMMLPVVLNTRDSPHGHGFLRFPEELSGEGCFGSTILRVIAGSGYKLFWAPQNAFVKSVDTTTKVEAKRESSSNVTESESESCRCIHVKDPNVMRKFIDTLQRYYLRAVQLRENGIANSHLRN